MTKDLRDGTGGDAVSPAGKLPWQAPKIESIKGRTASNSFSSFTGTDGTYYS